MTDVKDHPAKFSARLLHEFRRGLAAHGVPKQGLVLDPFAGVGRIHLLYPEYTTFGVEIEPEWANQSWPATLVGDATDLPWNDGSFDAIVTSPCYGNRMADHHDAKDGSKRHTYKHYLGRDLSDNNAGAMQWGDKYRDLHSLAWREAARVLKPGGVFVLNCKNHYRKGELQLVTEWHLGELANHGFALVEAVPVPCRGQRHGANGDKRVGFETVAYLRLGN